MQRDLVGALNVDSQQGSELCREHGKLPHSRKKVLQSLKGRDKTPDSVVKS